MLMIEGEAEPIAIADAALTTQPALAFEYGRGSGVTPSRRAPVEPAAVERRAKGLTCNTRGASVHVRLQTADFAARWALSMQRSPMAVCSSTKTITEVASPTFTRIPTMQSLTSG